MSHYAIILISLNYLFEALKVAFVVLGILCFIKYLKSENKH